MTPVAHGPYPGVILPWFKVVTSLRMLQVYICYKFKYAQV
ncbi:unnamed protein product [Camellia sinensis]